MLDYVLGGAALAGIFIAVAQLMALRRQRQRAFEDFFVHRYWQIMDGMSLEGTLGKKPEQRKPQPNDVKAVIAFLRLSEDEADLRAKGWISKGTWKLWCEGLATQLHRWPFDVVWQEVCAIEDQARPEDQFQTLRAYRVEISERRIFDPGPRWRRPFTGP